MWKTLSLPVNRTCCSLTEEPDEELKASSTGANVGAGANAGASTQPGVSDQASEHKPGPHSDHCKDFGECGAGLGVSGVSAAQSASARLALHSLGASRQSSGLCRHKLETMVSCVMGSSTSGASESQRVLVELIASTMQELRNSAQVKSEEWAEKASHGPQPPGASRPTPTPMPLPGSLPALSAAGTVPTTEPEPTPGPPVALGPERSLSYGNLCLSLTPSEQKHILEFAEVKFTACSASQLCDSSEILALCLAFCILWFRLLRPPRAPGARLGPKPVWFLPVYVCEGAFPMMGCWRPQSSRTLSEPCRSVRLETLSFATEMQCARYKVFEPDGSSREANLFFTDPLIQVQRQRARWKPVGSRVDETLFTLESRLQELHVASLLVRLGLGKYIASVPSLAEVSTATGPLSEAWVWEHTCSACHTVLEGPAPQGLSCRHCGERFCSATCARIGSANLSLCTISQAICLHKLHKQHNSPERLQVIYWKALLNSTRADVSEPAVE